VLLRLAYLTVANAFAVMRLLPMSDRDKDTETLALPHQITVLERQLDGEKVWFSPSDRAFLAALLHGLPSEVLRRIRLVVRPDTVPRRHRDLVARRHAARSRPSRPGRPRTVRSVRLLVLRLARENSNWGCHRTVINGVLYRARTGAPWPDLPERYGPWQTVYERHRRWSADRTWWRILSELQIEADAADPDGALARAVAAESARRKPEWA
jgi:transposase